MLAILAATALCVFAATLAYDPGGTVDPAPLAGPSAQDGEELRALDEAADAYGDGGQDAEAEEHEEAFGHKLAEVARGMLGVEISSVYAELFFPGPPDRSGQICGSAADIPAHLAKIRDAEWYVAFMEKYSSYPIEMHLNDERPKFGFHYGFIARSGDGGHASTYFHVDTCTGGVTDPASYLLMCFDKGSGYYDSRDYDTTVASLELGEFCVIPVSPWRQSIYGHLKEFEEDLDQYLEAVGRQRSEGPPRVPEEARLDSLKDLAHGMYRNEYSFSDADIQENIWSYCHRYGPLPEDFAALIEADGADRNLSAC